MWTDENMKIFRRKAIHYVNAEDHVRYYKYVEQSLKLFYDEKFEVNASILGAT